MEKFISMVEGTSSEISNVEQVDENLFKEFFSKSSVWDFHNMSRGECTTKSATEKEILIIKYYNEMEKGKSYMLYIGYGILSRAIALFNFFLSCHLMLTPLVTSFGSFQNGYVVGL